MLSRAKIGQRACGGINRWNITIKKTWDCDYPDLDKEEILPASRSLDDDDDDDDMMMMLYDRWYDILQSVNRKWFYTLLRL